MTDPIDTPANAPRTDEHLTERLARFDRELRVKGPHWSQAYDDLVGRLREAEAGSGAPKAGEPFPSFLLPDEKSHLVYFEDLIANGPLVISFNRGHWCNYCQMELRALQTNLPEIAASGASVISITPELPVYSAACKTENHLTFPLLCDLDLAVALSLGLAIPIGEHIATMLTDDGVQLSQLHGGTGWLLPIPATFVIARDGTIATCYVDPDFRRRLDPADILAALGQL